MKQMQWLIFITLVLVGNSNTHATPSVHKTVLPNGLTVLIRPTKTLQKVSTQLWINVGAKHENNNERGLAHWLEHMIFKGTQRMTEEDFMLTTNKLSGSCNAATSYDWTHFYIDLPVQHWYESLPILADCMEHCTFKQDLMDAEVQVVIQELKMYKDHFGRALVSKMLSTIFHDHPYHSPVIGYKKDLKNLTRNALEDFYKKYYVPSNATLVIVGNVDPLQAQELVIQYFGNIPAKAAPIPKEYSHEADISTHTSMLYRNVQRPLVNLAYVIPGFKTSQPYINDILMLILANQKQSRLRKLLVDDLQQVNWISCSTFELFDYDLFVISFEPKNYDDASTIISHIQYEINAIAQFGINNDELTTAMKQVEFSHYSFLENNHAQATALATSHLARNDAEYIFERYIMKDFDTVKAQVQTFAANYLRAWVMHKGCVLPLPQEEQKNWNQLQNASNNEDADILKNKQRQTELEKPSYAVTIQPKKPIDTIIPQPTIISLENGLKVYYYHNPTIPKIHLILQLKATSVYQSKDEVGIIDVLSLMLQEGTQHYSREQLNKKLAQHGIRMHIAENSIRMEMLKAELPVALTLLEEVVIRPTFDKASLKKVKALMLAQLEHSADSPTATAQLLVDEYFYDGHPYAHSALLDEKSIGEITQNDLFAAHAQWFNPDDAALIIVGDLADYAIPEIVHRSIAYWQGPKIADIVWPEIIPNASKPTAHYMEREQIILKLACLSVARNHPDYFKLLLFDMVLHEKLFSLRSRSGAFYAINGTLLHGSGKQPGLMCITANVSQTRIDEAEALIREALPEFIASFNEEDLAKAKMKLLNMQVESYATHAAIAETFAFLHEQNLPPDYYQQRSIIIESITLDEVKEAAARLIDPTKLVTFKVGRVNNQTKEQMH